VIEPQSKLAHIAGATEIAANSSHHQSAGEIGDGLRVVARCKQDGIVEALEGTSPEHFVLAVQWHPERSTSDAPSRALFSSLVEAARARHLQLQGEFESV
jgi:putative glutamine amidotransferase